MDILLVDDDREVLAAIGTFLEDRGHRLATAPNATAALELMGLNLPDVILCDIQMPGMDGIAFLRACRSRFRQTPVVLMTADRDLDMAIQAIRGGAADYLKKPVNVIELMSCLERSSAGGSSGR
jgi:two-component system, NtrC family, C4-dicarboxylate transport response regulator DctD